MDSLTISTFRNLERQAIRERYQEIYAHELAHKNAAGSLAGSIVIEKNSQGVPVGGHVDVKMPVLDPENPQSTIDDANTVINAALAPAEPSSQDYDVEQEARNVKNQAQQIKNRTRLDYYA